MFKSILVRSWMHANTEMLIRNFDFTLKRLLSVFPKSKQRSLTEQNISKGLPELSGREFISKNIFGQHFQTISGTKKTIARKLERLKLWLELIDCCLENSWRFRLPSVPLAFSKLRFCYRSQNEQLFAEHILTHTRVIYQTLSSGLRTPVINVT